MELLTFEEIETVAENTKGSKHERRLAQSTQGEAHIVDVRSGALCGCIAE